MGDESVKHAVQYEQAGCGHCKRVNSELLCALSLCIIYQEFQFSRCFEMIEVVLTILVTFC